MFKFIIMGTLLREVVCPSLRRVYQFIKSFILTFSSNLFMYFYFIFSLCRCPELNACISAALWCDGERHCPSGFDEADVNCAYQLPVPTLYVATGAAAIGLLAISIAITACIKLRRSAANKPGSGLTSGAAVGGPGGPVTAAALNATVGKPHGNRHVVVGAGGGGMGIPGVAATHRHHHHHHRAHNGSADKRYHPGADDLYMDGKDSLC